MPKLTVIGSVGFVGRKSGIKDQIFSYSLFLGTTPSSSKAWPIFKRVTRTISAFWEFVYTIKYLGSRIPQTLFSLPMPIPQSNQYRRITFERLRLEKFQPTVYTTSG